MEITFARTTRYSVDVNGSDLKDLAKALDMSKAKLIRTARDAELTSDHMDIIARWIDEKPMTHSIVDEENIEDLEVWIEVE